VGFIHDHRHLRETKKKMVKGMFDPTVFENIKVVLEGAVYEQDLSGEIVIVNRRDTVDLANLTRVYEIQFSLAQVNQEIAAPRSATVRLLASGADLAGEILELSSDGMRGCMVQVLFEVWITNIRDHPERIYSVLKDIWGGRPHIKQKLAFEILEDQKDAVNPSLHSNEILLDFGRKLGEEQMDDILRMVDYTIRSLQQFSFLSESE
jgi:hypothetical protein